MSGTGRPEASVEQSRDDVAARLTELEERVRGAQQLANMGDYDWHIPTDTNRWSDHLYRIFGYEPQSRDMNYETYLSHVHPDDQERTKAVHQHAYVTGEPFSMMHRIVRPDGVVRWLACNGETVRKDGEVVLLRGTAVDVTERVLAEEARSRDAARLAQVELRRRQSAEINDTIIQGITAALYAIELGETASAQTYLERTLESARGILDELATPTDVDELGLVRSEAAVLSQVDERADPAPSS